MNESDQLGPSYDGTVVLDIGNHIGALIIHTPQSMHLAEIEISPLSDGAAPAHRTHAAVRERRGPSGVRFAAIYPHLTQGEYTVWGPDGEPADTVRIRGGQVAQLDWR